MKVKDRLRLRAGPCSPTTPFSLQLCPGYTQTVDTVDCGHWTVLYCCRCCSLKFIITSHCLTSISTSQSSSWLLCRSVSGSKNALGDIYWRISNIFINKVRLSSALLAGLVHNVVQSGSVVLQDVGTSPQQGREVPKRYVVGVLLVVVVEVIVTGKSGRLLTVDGSYDDISGILHFINRLE